MRKLCIIGTTMFCRLFIMKIIADRLCGLHEGVKLWQTRFAELVGSTQSSINQYKQGQTSPPFKLLLWYADYFNVSLDYIFGRTDNP